MVTAAASTFIDRQRSFANDLEAHSPAAIAGARNYLDSLVDYLASARGSGSMGGRFDSGTGGTLGSASADSRSTTDAPALVQSVDVASIVDSDPVTSKDQFEKVTYEHTVWGLDRLKSVVEPAVALGKGLDYFEERDRGEGLSGERSNAGVYRWFYGSASWIKLRRETNGSVGVINGRHRLYAARQLGIHSLPATIR